jgi:predicted PurR-regulated permease PerM
MDTEWRRITKYLVGIGLAVFGLYILYLSRAVLPLLIIAALIAFLVRPMIRFLRLSLKFPRGIAVLVTYLLATIIILLAPLIFVPPIVNTVKFFLELDYQALVDNTLQWIESQLLGLKAIDIQMLGIDIDLNSVIDPFLAFLENATPVISPQLPSFSVIVNSISSAFVVSYGIAVGLVGGVVTFIFIILAAIYMSLDAHRFYDYFMSLVPRAYRVEMVILLWRLKKVWQAFFRGQVTLMFFIGTFVWLGGTMLGLPGAFPLGIVAGLLEIIPNLGPFLAAVPAVIVALLQGSTVLEVNNIVFALIIIAFYMLLQALENNIVVPRVLGGAVDLHPLVVLTGVFVGATVWGILGVLLAAPVIASAREIARYLYLKMLGEVPYPPEGETPEKIVIPWWEAGKVLITKVQQFIQQRRDSLPAPQETPSQNPEESQS